MMFLKELVIIPARLCKASHKVREGFSILRKLGIIPMSYGNLIMIEVYNTEKALILGCLLLMDPFHDPLPQMTQSYF